MVSVPTLDVTTSLSICSKILLSPLGIPCLRKLTMKVIYSHDKEG